MFVNGKEMGFEGQFSIDNLLERLGLNRERVVVEVNFEIVSQEEYSTRVLQDDDKVEIVGFVGGG